MLKMQDILQGGIFQDNCIITNVKKSHNTTNGIVVYKLVFLVNIDNVLYTFNATTQDWFPSNLSILQFDNIYSANIKFTYYTKTFKCKVHSIDNLTVYDKGVL